MCGIVGVIGSQDALPEIFSGLERLEYRGYDSAGIALVEGDRLVVQKAQGPLKELGKALDRFPAGLRCGIGHTRWATHGKPTNENAHPHLDCKGRIAAVHNGIIENYQDLRQELLAAGHIFKSDTDTEVIPHLLEAYGGAQDLTRAAAEAIPRLEGAFAFVAVSAGDPNHLVAVRKASPLLVGIGAGTNYVASDISAFLAHTREALVLNDGDVAVVSPQSVELYHLAGDRLDPVQREPFHVAWDIAQAERGGYPHFMLKEIMEQPKVWGDCLLGRVAAQGGHPSVRWDGLGLDPERARRWQRIQIVAAGTAYHAGVVGRTLIERLTRIPVDIEVASEFRYRDPILLPGTAVWSISQSGETADTLAGVRLARQAGAFTYAICNTVGSTVARESDGVVYTHAGPEIAVASTKAYTTQVLVLTLLACGLAELKGQHSGELLRGLMRLPEQAEAWISRMEQQVRAMVGRMETARDVFYIGRGLDYALALEGQLKLKEISYQHAEAYPAGELKHGTLALIEEGVPVVAVLTQPDTHEKMVSNIQEVKARGAEVWVLAPESLARGLDPDHWVALPEVHPLLAPAVAAIPLQLLAYWMAVARGENVDQPRNLAKSVTVE